MKKKYQIVNKVNKIIKNEKNLINLLDKRLIYIIN